jgi:hydroxymethylpyrimidine/phosphomethylpyrimidine kinase
MKPVALTITGSDPSGGAGLQADLKTFHQFGVYGMSVVTLLTAQNTRGVETVEVLDRALVGAQLDSVLEDIPPGAVKTGAMGSLAIVEAVALRASALSVPLVVDPVMVSGHGTLFLPLDAQEALRTRLLPLAYLVTPNLHEAQVLSGREVKDVKTAVEAARAIHELGARAVVIKGIVERGHSIDLLWYENDSVQLESPWLDTKNVHGSGCTFSAAITAELAKGTSLELALFRAKAYISSALEKAPGLGGGAGPVDHHAGS